MGSSRFKHRSNQNLNSRFSSRARRRLVQAEASVQGVGNNYYAAGAVVLDPDPTVLRGMVSLGTHLRYWSYSSTAADQYKSGKRKLRRRSERGSNAANGEQRFTHTGRGILKDYIANEKYELEREKVMRRKEHERLSGRFGTDLLGPGVSEEEMLAYATMLSEESYTSDRIKRRGSGEVTAALSSNSSDTVHEEGGVSLSLADSATSPLLSTPSNETEPLDPDVAEAIRLSLLEEEARKRTSLPASNAVSTSYSKTPAPSASALASPSRSSPLPSSSHYRSSTTVAEEDDDLGLALQLSLAEQQSRLAGGADSDDALNEEEFPALASPDSEDSVERRSREKGKGKGKGRGARRGRDGRVWLDSNCSTDCWNWWLASFICSCLVRQSAVWSGNVEDLVCSLLEYLAIACRLASEFTHHEPIYAID